MGIRNDQRGIAHIGIILVVLILAVAGGAYYFVSKANKEKNDSPPQSAASKEVQDACNKAYDDKDFCRFVSSWKFGGEMKMTWTTPEDGSVSIIETDGSGNTRMTTTQDGSESYAAITIGKTTYIKNPDQNNWMKYETPDTDSADDVVGDFESELDFDSEITKDTTKITKQAKEACGNLTCFKYVITDTNAPGEETTVWFDDKDYLLRRMATKNSDGESTMTVEYEVADITAPSPVVDMPSFNENMSQEDIQRIMEQYAN